ncbi:hypothetical protein PV11_08776 [Exophiala sideris]|uniref:DUF6603 domain-containing protein n=1 Tax=Exophiala sideris TaxID=1016849 RepID=A0A0D1Y1X5_9EURO|nr:hypothetical protein PV11_08776 [Exophiala sideris]
MSLDPSASASVLNSSQSQPLSEWVAFLSQPEIGCSLAVKADGGLTCTFTEDGLWSYVFDSSQNNPRFSKVDFHTDDGQIVIGLESGAEAPSLIDVLKKFGVVAGDDDPLPNDNGEMGDSIPASSTKAPQKAALPADLVPPKGQLFRSVVDNAIGRLTKLKVDPSEHRNAIWFTPGMSLSTDMALTFIFDTQANDVLSNIAKLIQQEFGINFLSATSKLGLKIILQKTSVGTESTVTDTGGNKTSQWSVRNAFRAIFQLTVGEYVFSITLTGRGMEFSFTNPDRANILSMIGLSGTLKDDSFTDVLSAFSLLRVVGGLDVSGTAYWEVTISLTLGSIDTYFNYNSLSSTFSGGLITAGFYAFDDDKRLPSFNPAEAIMAPTGYTTNYYFNIRDMSKEFSTLPSVLPTAIVMAVISYQIDSSTISFDAKLIRAPDERDSSDPQVPSPFAWDEVDISLSKSKAADSFSCALLNRFTLTSSDGQADLGLTINYTNSDWLVVGYANNLTGKMLTPFFDPDPDFRDGLNAVIGRLSIPSLQAVYTYDKGSSSPQGTGATSFAIGGTVQLGLLQLRLFFQYASSKAGKATAATASIPGETTSDASTPFLPTDTKVQQLTVSATPDPKNPGKETVQTSWSFECDLGSAPSPDDKATLGTVVDSIIDGGASSLPSFLANIPFPSAVGDKSLIVIKVAKKAADATGPGSIAFAFRITLDSFTFTFAQICSHGSKSPKQILRFTATSIPMMQDIPLVDTLPQPFDELEYMWVNDAGGLLESEVTILNTLVLSAADVLYYRPLSGQSAKQPPSSVPDTVVLIPGHHFMVIRHSQAVIDHVFATSTPAPQQSLGQVQKTKTLRGAPPLRRISGRAQKVQEAVPGAGKTIRDDIAGTVSGKVGKGAAQDSSPITPPAQPLVAASPPTKGAIDFSLGPLSISGLAIQFKEQDSNNKVISVTMDATFAMGPITFSLIGFSLDIPLAGITLDDLKSLTNITPGIEGLALVFDQPPLLVAGGFEHKQTGSVATGDFQNVFLGGVGISWPPYTFVGLGEYAILQNYKSVFLYAKLDGPIITLEFATITGIRLGFGYNSLVTSPTVNQLTDFPFINDKKSSGNNPLDIVKNMTQTGPPWVAPKPDSYWFAAGLTLTAFDILTVTALAMLAFRNNGVSISLYADAVAQMPADATSTSDMIIYVEIGLVAEMNTVDGYFQAQASLAPTSFLLTEKCHLYGGFAMAYWFGSNPHAGDWVFSAGGYHPAYQKPEWYPTVQRLGISWNPGACMAVTGEVYFAVTPKVVMGGASIHVTLSIGPVSAWLDASFDCLINFHPLHYQADFHIGVGVSCDIDIWFIHIHIECSVGAWLTVQGPDFGGVAHVDFYLFGFDVDFGASPAAKPPLSLVEFWQMVHQPGPTVPSTETQAADRIRPVLLLDDDVQPLVDKPVYKQYTTPDDIPIEGAAFKYILEDGNFPMPNRPHRSTQVAPPANQAENTGTGAEWYVKGGTFKFRIATDFPLSYAQVEAGNNGDTGAEVEVPGPKPAPGQPVPDTGIYSRPMQVDQSIHSELVVTITEKNTGRQIGGWTKGAFDIKSVPQATFGKYSIDTDPSKSGANDLLNHDKATMPLGMGLILSAPLPDLAESLIPVFSASDADSLGIGDFRYLSTGDDNFYLPRFEPLAIPDVVGTLPPPPFKPLVQTQQLYLPSELTKNEENMSPQDLCNEVGDEWTNAAKAKKDVVGDTDVGVIVQVQRIFGWKEGWAQKAQAQKAAVAVEKAVAVKMAKQGASAPISTTAREVWELTGDFPVKLVRDVDPKGNVLKNLEDTYLAFPRLGVVS